MIITLSLNTYQESSNGLVWLIITLSLNIYTIYINIYTIYTIYQESSNGLVWLLITLSLNIYTIYQESSNSLCCSSNSFEYL